MGQRILITIETAEPNPYIRGPRYDVIISGEDGHLPHRAYLTYNGFKLLVILAIWEKHGTPWVSLDNLAQHNTRFCLYRLCRDLQLKYPTVILNNRTKKYCLNTDGVSVIITDLAMTQLRTCDDADLQVLSKVKTTQKPPYPHTISNIIRP